MTELKTVTETEGLIKKILSKRDKEINDITEKIETAKQNAVKAEKETSKAILTGDLKTYQTAKAKKKDADDAVEMYTEMLDALQNKSLVTLEEYENVLNKIKAEVNSYCELSKKELIRYTEPLKELMNDNSETLNHVNKVLSDWQGKVGQITPYKFNEKTGRQEQKEEVKGNAWSVYRYLETVFNDTYKSIIK